MRKDSKSQQQEYQRQQPPPNDFQRIGGIVNQNIPPNAREKPLPKRDSYQNPVYGESPSKNVLQENPSYSESPGNYNSNNRERDILTNNIPKSNAQSSDNIMSAVLLLVRELDERYLELVKREVDKRLAGLKNK